MAALAWGHEGVMAKRLVSTYRTGRRSPAWRKIKPHRPDNGVNPIELAVPPVLLHTRFSVAMDWPALQLAILARGAPVETAHDGTKRITTGQAC